MVVCGVAVATRHRRVQRWRSQCKAWFGEANGFFPHRV